MALVIPSPISSKNRQDAILAVSSADGFPDFSNGWRGWEETGSNEKFPGSKVAVHRAVLAQSFPIYQ